MGKLKIISKSDEPFKDREEAGILLAEELAEYHDRQAVVLGIPRGGLVVGKEIAERLSANLDIVLAHKLPTPGQPELAMGSVSEDGRLFLNSRVISSLGVSDAYIQKAKEQQMAEIKRRVELFRKARLKAPLAGRIVIITDDGVATGATAQAAIWAVRAEKPKKLIVAIPVAPEDTINCLAEDADETICLRLPPFFAAVGQFYLKFEQVEDYEVLKILKESL